MVAVSQSVWLTKCAVKVCVCVQPLISALSIAGDTEPHLRSHVLLLLLLLVAYAGGGRSLISSRTSWQTSIDQQLLTSSYCPTDLDA